MRTKKQIVNKPRFTDKKDQKGRELLLWNDRAFQIPLHIYNHCFLNTS